MTPTTDLIARLRATYTAWNNPPSDGLPEGAGVVLEAADALAAQEAELAKRVIQFAEAILHGDDEHRAWLMDAAKAFVSGQELPPPNGKGRAEAAEAELARLREALADIELDITLAAGISRGYDLKPTLATIRELLAGRALSGGGK